MTALEMFENRLRKLKKEREKWAGKNNISCYRIYEEDIPQVPIILERYADSFFLWDRSSLKYQTEEEREERLQALAKIVASVFQVSLSQVRTKRKEKQKGKSQYTRLDFQKEEILVEEAGLQFWINTTDYLDTGLFLDHRGTRSYFRSLASGKKVLNLFSYTGSFSVYALSGKARSVTQVDLSQTYLDWSERNLRENGFHPGQWNTVRADISEWITEGIRNKNRDRFDLIFVDPPTFSNSKKMIEPWEVQTGYAKLLVSLVDFYLRPEGILLFSTNYRKFVWDMDPDIWKDREMVVQDITDKTWPEDFRNKKTRQLFEIRFDSLGQQSTVLS